MPRLWPGSTIVCIGSGPSLTTQDIVEARRSGAILVAINNACFVCSGCDCLPDVLYAGDAQWWAWHRDVPDDLLPYYQFTLQPEAKAFRWTVRVLNWRLKDGIDHDPSRLATGGHGGFQAINLAVHLGARRIVLLGYDMQPGAFGEHHCHPEHPNLHHPRYEVRKEVYSTLLGPLQDLGITIRNASRETAITAIPRCTLAEALA